MLERSLPPSPEWAEPVTTPDPKKGEDALVIAARERSAKSQANYRLTEFRNWYEEIRAAYAGNSP